jgi:hypothetical protein
MARSTAKVILFSRLAVDDKSIQWPTAVFNTHDEAKSYATMIKMAHTSGAVETAKSLDPRTALDKSGKFVPGLRFSIVEVPYQPTPALADGDLFGDEDGKTS